MLTVAAVMSTGAVAVDARAAVPEIVDVVERCQAGTVAVVDGSGRLLGAFEPGDYPDLFQSCAARAPRVAGSRRHRERRTRIGRGTARELMSPFPVLTDTCPLDKAVRSLDDADAELALVVDRLGCVVGTVTRLACRAVLTMVVRRPAPGTRAVVATAAGR
jgi:CBS-domain-containing membrane protein